MILQSFQRGEDDILSTSTILQPKKYGTPAGIALKQNYIKVNVKLQCLVLV